MLYSLTKTNYSFLFICFEQIFHLKARCSIFIFLTRTFIIAVFVIIVIWNNLSVPVAKYLPGNSDNSFFFTVKPKCLHEVLCVVRNELPKCMCRFSISVFLMIYEDCLSCLHGKSDYSVSRSLLGCCEIKPRPGWVWAPRNEFLPKNFFQFLK